MKPLSPLILSAQISPPAGGGSFGLSDTSKLENPFQAPMWLDEISFTLTNSTGQETSQAWSSLRVELKLGEVPITKGFVPISLLGKVLNDSFEVTVSGSGSTPARFTWVLPKPLFIPARELLRPTIYFEPYSGAPATTVNITYRCRPLPRGTPTPKTLQIPWATFFKPDYLSNPNAVDTTDQSTPADLYNPFDQDMHVQRFIGRLMVRDSGELNTLMGLASGMVTLSTGVLFSGTMVTAQDSFNNILVRDLTPFSFLFGTPDRAWTVNCVLPPKGFYLFTTDRLWSNYVPFAGATVVATVGIGMVGWREVPNRV